MREAVRDGGVGNASAASEIGMASPQAGQSGRPDHPWTVIREGLWTGGERESRPVM